MPPFSRQSFFINDVELENIWTVSTNLRKCYTGISKPSCPSKIRNAISFPEILHKDKGHNKKSLALELHDLMKRYYLSPSGG